MTAVVVLLAVAVALLAALVVSLLRSHAEILRALHDLGVDLDPSPEARARAARAALAVTSAGGVAAADLPGGTVTTVAGVPEPAEVLGSAAADVAGIDPQGDAVAVGVVGQPHRTLLAFLTTGCTTCRGFWAALATGAELPAPDIRVVIVTRGEEAESPPEVARIAPVDVPTVMSTDAWEDYGVPVAPYFVLVDGDEVVGEGAAATWPQVVDLLGKALADTGRSLPAGGPSRRGFLTGRERAARIDDELTAAGFEPGDPRLHHEPGDIGR